MDFIDDIQIQSEMENRTNFLKNVNNISFDKKVAWSKARILEWINHWGIENVAVAFSGGKDSTILVHLCYSVIKDNKLKGKLKIVFSNTGIEYPELVKFVKQFSAEVKSDSKWIEDAKKYLELQIVTPKESQAIFYKKQIPAISKEISQGIWEIRNSKRGRKTILYRFGIETDKNGKIIGRRTMGGLSKKWLHFIDKDFIKYEVGSKCCNIYKKKPTAALGYKMIVGTTIFESRLRRSTWIKNGCNSFNGGKAKSSPISLWNETDIAKYKAKHRIRFADCYYPPFNFTRTGCYNCPYPLSMEENEIRHETKVENKYESLKRLYPGMYRVSMYDIGFEKVLLDMMIPIRTDLEYMDKLAHRSEEVINWHLNLRENMIRVLRNQINEQLVGDKLSEKDIEEVLKRYDL